MNILLNIPMFILGWKLLGRKEFLTGSRHHKRFCIFKNFSQTYQFPLDLHNDLLLASLFAGVFVGVGLGIIFRCGGTTGGVDIIARLANKYIGWSMGKNDVSIRLFSTSCLLVNFLKFHHNDVYACGCICGS